MDFLTLLAGLGAVQGFLLLLLIFLRFRHRKNLSLALLVLVFSLRLGTIPLWNPASLLAHPWLWPLTTPLPFLFGPLLWWYARELSSEADSPPPLLPLHFLPYILETFLVAVTVALMSPLGYREFVASVFAGSPPAWLPLRNGLKVALNILYVSLTGRIAFGPAGSRVLLPANRLWLRSLVVVPIASLIPFAFVALYPGASAKLAEGAVVPFILVAAAMALLIYSFSFLVLLAPDGPEGRGPVFGHHPAPGLTEAECRLLADLVCRRLDEGAYRNPELSLTRLARELEVPPNRLSSAVNCACNLSFRKLVNRRRVKHFVDETRAGALGRLSILELALEAGFPSKSTFNRVFKEEMKMSPSEYAEKGV